MLAAKNQLMILASANVNSERAKNFYFQTIVHFLRIQNVPYRQKGKCLATPSGCLHSEVTLLVRWGMY